MAIKTRQNVCTGANAARLINTSEIISIWKSIFYVHFLLLLLLLHIVSFDFYVYLRGKNHCNNNKMIIIHSTAQQLNPVMLTDRVKTMCAESCRREVGFVCLCID